MEADTKTQTAFQRYLEALGDKKAAEHLRVPKRTVQSWRLGERLPRPTQAREITLLAPISMNDIYGERVA